MSRLFQSDLPLNAPSLAGYVALSREVLRLSDAYEIPIDRPYTFNPAIDTQTGYRTRSVLAVPLQESTGDVIGVFQLINALDARNQIVPFDPDYEPLLRALASQATVAVRNAQLEEVARGRAALRSVASLVTVMAHEINNPLMVIKGNIQLIVRDGAVSDPVSRERMDAVLGAVDAIHKVVQRMHRIIELRLAMEKREP
jgi:signal transduction histidine kinase